MRRVAILFAIIASMSSVRCVVPRNPVGLAQAVKRPFDLTHAVAKFFAAFLRRIMLPRLSEAGRQDSATVFPALG